MQPRLVTRWMIVTAVLILAALSCGRGGGGGSPVLVASAPPDGTSPGTIRPVDTPVPQPVGYLTREGLHPGRAGNPTRVPLHVWYPTRSSPTAFEYHTIGDGLQLEAIKTSLALDAPVDRSRGPYPVLLFFHGAFTCGTQSVFLTEYLARQGFIVAAPDFTDAYRLCGEWDDLDPRWKVLGGLRDMRRASAHRRLEILELGSRVPGASMMLDQLLSWNEDPESTFYQTMEPSRIGVIGHSLGGETALGLIGPHPDPSFEDERIKAVVILSSAVFPLQEQLDEIEIPVMVMEGDEGDSEDLHDIARRKVYDDAQGPGYFLMIEDGVHGSFGNGVCPADSTPVDCVQSDSLAGLIASYSADFFAAYLRGDRQAMERISRGSPGLAGFDFREE